MQIELKTLQLKLLCTFPTSIRLGWKGLPWTNTPAYHNHCCKKVLLHWAQVSPFLLKVHQNIKSGLVGMGNNARQKCMVKNAGQKHGAKTHI